MDKPVKSIFLPKYLNIMDPLNEDNNIGRSVSLSSSYRIRAALQKGRILLDDFIDRSSKMTPLHASQFVDFFFKNTRRIYPGTARPDVDKHHQVTGSHQNKMKIFAMQQQFFQQQFFVRNQVMSVPRQRTSSVESEDTSRVYNDSFLNNMNSRLTAMVPFPPPLRLVPQHLIATSANSYQEGIIRRTSSNNGGLTLQVTPVKPITFACDNATADYLPVDHSVPRASDDTNHFISLPMINSMPSYPLSAPITPPFSSMMNNSTQWRHPQPRYFNPSLVREAKNSMSFGSVHSVSSTPPMHPVYLNKNETPLFPSNLLNMYPAFSMNDPRMQSNIVITTTGSSKLGTTASPETIDNQPYSTQEKNAVQSLMGQIRIKMIYLFPI